MKNNRGKIIAVVIGLFAIAFLFSSFSLFENLNADEVMVVQSPISGELTWYTTAGIKWQGFGTVTHYIKLETYEFAIPVRFNDGGHGTINGSINYEVPLDTEHLTQLHTKYGSQESIQKDLIEVVANKCIYMTGPLMSSKESYAEKRTSLIFYIEDQIKNGVYKTTQKDTKIKDPITGADKTVTVAEIVVNNDNKALRQEEAVLAEYGIKTSNFAVTSLPYDETVESQIRQQQEINMSVQTSMATAKQAEQKAITVEKEGQASAAKAKWDQEIIKAKEVTQAQQRLEVARLEKLAAAENKQKLILEGEGEAAKKRLTMQADGALTQKLEAWKYAQEKWAEAWGKNGAQIVPTISSGGGTNNTSSLNNFLELQSMKAAKELGLNLGMKKGNEE